MNIPDEAVQAAAKVLWSKEMNVPWSSVAYGYKVRFVRDAREALKAAEPYIIAEATGPACYDCKRGECEKCKRADGGLCKCGC